MLKSSMRRGQIYLQKPSAFSDMGDDFVPDIARNESVMLLDLPPNEDDLVLVCALQACGCPDLNRVTGMWPEELVLIQLNPPHRCNWLQRALLA